MFAVSFTDLLSISAKDYFTYMYLLMVLILTHITGLTSYHVASGKLVEVFSQSSGVCR